MRRFHFVGYAEAEHGDWIKRDDLFSGTEVTKKTIRRLIRHIEENMVCPLELRDSGILDVLQRLAFVAIKDES